MHEFLCTLFSFQCTILFILNTYKSVSTYIFSNRIIRVFGQSPPLIKINDYTEIYLTLFSGERESVKIHPFMYCVNCSIIYLKIQIFAVD